MAVKVSNKYEQGMKFTWQNRANAWDVKNLRFRGFGRVSKNYKKKNKKKNINDHPKNEQDSIRK